MRAVLPVTRRAGTRLVTAVGLTVTEVRVHAKALDVLGALRGLRVVDLTQPLGPSIPYWPGDGYGPFRYTPINFLERDGKAAGVFEMPEHMGTHLDAPNHFVASPVSVDAIPLEKLLRPAVVFDIAERAANDPGALLEIDDIQAWETRWDTVPSGSVALVRSGWSARWSDAASFRNEMRFPAISEAAARRLVIDRGVLGVGVDTLSADNGAAPNSPCHRLVHGAGGYILENLANLEQLPESGAFVLIAPIPIVGGTGAPARVLAFI
jgi:kynurenine formamidase